MAFTHARNLIYKHAGHSVAVLNFSARESYEWDDFPVFCESDLTKAQIEQFDLFIFHAPNLRNHLRFILKHRDSIRAKVIIGHGHEFINAATQAGRPYPFQMTLKMRAKLLALYAYDWLKIQTWKWYFKAQKGSGLALIFVSDWLRQNVEQCLQLDLNSLVNVSVINNPIHPAFQDSNYDANSPKIADFITLRSFDTSKYAVDIVAEIAARNPQYTFHIYGNGDYFKYNPPPPNLTVIKKKFCQPDLPALFNKYRAGLLPTRWDSQGVLMCEMACMGLPVVVSNLPICKLMVGEFENVSYVENEDPVLNGIPKPIALPPELKLKFGPDRTVVRELDLFEKVVREGRVDRAVPGTFFLASLLGFAKGLAVWGRRTSTQ